MNAFLYVLVATFWGGSFVAIKPLVEVLPPVFAAALRILIALIFIALAAAAMRLPLKLPGKTSPLVWLTGQFAFTIPFSLLFWGERLISPGLAGIINGTVPLFVFALGTLINRNHETLTLRKVAGLLMGISGLVVIFWPALNLSEGFSVAGTTAVTFMAIAYAIAGLLNRKIFAESPGLQSITNLVHQLASASVTIVPFALLFDRAPDLGRLSSNPLLIGALLYLGVGSTGLAFLVYFRLIRAWGAIRATTVTYLIPLAALFFDFILNHQVPSPSELLGILIVTTGVLLLNFNFAAFKQPRR